MDKAIENIKKKRDLLYYNQLTINEPRVSVMSKSKKLPNRKAKSFGSQKVDFKSFLFVPDSWEFEAYLFYIVSIPYFVGALFLFFFIARGDFATFQLLNMNAFLIIWLIGYEIVAAFSLMWIMFLYLTYKPEAEVV